MRDWAEDLLSPAELDATGLVRTDVVRGLWQAHLAGQTNAQYGLWTVLMLQSWRKYFASLAG
jgi:asparagine synthase (glutamine-hydrolysing)